MSIRPDSLPPIAKEWSASEEIRPFPDPSLSAGSVPARGRGQSSPAQDHRLDSEQRGRNPGDGRRFSHSEVPGVGLDKIEDDHSAFGRRRRGSGRCGQRSAPKVSALPQAKEFLGWAIGVLDRSLSDPPAEGDETRATSLAVRRFRLGEDCGPVLELARRYDERGSPAEDLWDAVKDGLGDPLEASAVLLGLSRTRVERALHELTEAGIADPGSWGTHDAEPGALRGRVVRTGLPPAGRHRKGTPGAAGSLGAGAFAGTRRLRPSRRTRGRGSPPHGRSRVTGRRAPALLRQGGNRQDRGCEDSGPRFRRPSLRPLRTGVFGRVAGGTHRPPDGPCGRQAKPLANGAGVAAERAGALRSCATSWRMCFLPETGAGGRIIDCWKTRRFRSYSPETICRSSTRRCFVASI